MSVFNPTVLENESIVVTGATGDIGSSIIDALAGTGSELLITGRNTQQLEEIADSVSGGDDSAKVITHSADLTNQTEREGLVEAAKQFGVTMLVNSAGITGNRSDFEDLTHEQITEIMQINYTATVLFSRDIYAKLKQSGAGAIVNIASLSGLRGTYKSIPYCSSKFALVGFTQSLALEAVEHDIRVNAICPGWVDTEMGRTGIESKAKAHSRTFKEQLEHELADIPSGRMTAPEEVANAVVFLLSDAVENTIGESLKISGGTVLR